MVLALSIARLGDAIGNSILFIIIPLDAAALFGDAAVERPCRIDSALCQA